MTKKSLAVLGLDAMNSVYFEKLLDSGIMPYTKHLIEKSLIKNLRAFPPMTPPSWSSIMTGVNPGKHGIYGFFHYSRRTLSQRLYNALDLKQPRIHEMLSILGYKSIVFNPIPDYPLIPVRSAEILSNLFFTPKPVSYPASIYDFYFRGSNPIEHTKDMTCNLLNDYVNVVNLYLHAVEKALQTDHSLIWITLNIPDIFFHRCPKILTEKSVSNEERNVFGLIDKLIKMLDEEHDSIIIVSDHGFARYDKTIGVNDILIQHGFARASKNKGLSTIQDYKIREGFIKPINFNQVKINPRTYVFLKKTRLNKIARILVKAYQKITGKKIVVSTSLSIDPELSLAFLDNHAYGIYVKNRSIIKELYAVLEKYKHYLDVFDPESLYNGPYINEGPDIMVFPKFDEGYTMSSNLIGAPLLRGEYYAHHPLGIFAVKSDEIDKNYCSETTVIPNHAVAQVALHVMGLPLPSNRDHAGCFEELFRGDKSYNYTGKWSLLMKVQRARKKMGR
ncbi:MAG: alkaline phosphatase family protein [Desulfurococcales archaeon]|nr:alkaline phosphatase family protein [Desulfurococcales archaeon]